MAILQESMFVLMAAAAMLTTSLVTVFLLRGRSATLRWQVLAVTVVLVLALPVMTRVLPAPPAGTPTFSTTQRVVAEPVATAVDKAGAPRIVTDEEIEYPAVESMPYELWILAGLGVWLFGVARGSIRLVRSHARARRLVDAAPRVTDRRLLDLMPLLALQLDVRRPVDLLQSAAVESPLSVGWLRPRILLPNGAEIWPKNKLRTVLGHELAHIKRGDAAVSLAGNLVAILHWFNPLAWWVLSRLRHEAEKACDDAVLRLGVRPSTYARVLLEQAATPAPPRLATAAPFACHAEQRLQAVLDPATDHGASRFRAGAAFALILLVVILPLTSVRPAARADQPADIGTELQAPSLTIRIDNTESGPGWWRELKGEFREMKAVKRWLADPAAGTNLPEGATAGIGGEWTVEAHDAVALEGAKYGAVFTSDEGFIRIRRLTVDGIYEFGVYAFPHPPLEGGEVFMENLLQSVGLGYSDNLRGYRIPHGHDKADLAQLRAVVAAYATELQSPTQPNTAED